MSEARDVGALCRRYGSMVLRRCRRLLRNEAEALDACQDVFVRLIEQRGLAVRYPGTLLFRMATHVCLNRIRDRGRRPDGHYADPDGEADDRLYRIACAVEPGGQVEARLLLDRLFGRHPESSRTMAVLHYVDGLTLDEVAAITGMSVSGVRKRLRGLRETLKEMDR
jgi:RNA polymerase sigma-70 factor (ECF subfamily)